MPLITFVPGAPGHRRIPGPISLVDVVPTLLGLTGLVGGRESEGEDLSRYLVDAGEAPRDANSGPVFSESVSGPGGRGAIYAVRFGNWKLVRHPDGTERFFSVQGIEREIIAARGRQGRMRQDLSDTLTRWLARREGRR